MYIYFNEYFEQNHKKETILNVRNFDFVRKMLYKTSKRKLQTLPSQSHVKLDAISIVFI